MKSLFLVSFISSVITLGIHFLWFHNPEPAVVYVGTDCQGASSVAVARTSFDLPPCASIEVHQVAG